jgi:hypothetical protein
MACVLRTVQRAAETNVVLAEDYLGRTSIGDRGHDCDQPPAAGVTWKALHTKEPATLHRPLGGAASAAQGADNHRLHRCRVGREGSRAWERSFRRRTAAQAEAGDRP